MLHGMGTDKKLKKKKRNLLLQRKNRSLFVLKCNVRLRIYIGSFKIFCTQNHAPKHFLFFIFFIFFT